ncbi:MAG: hypothetical protein ABJZ69_18980 [Hyphomicrobiales bacterium]
MADPLGPIGADGGNWKRISNTFKPIENHAQLNAKMISSFHTKYSDAFDPQRNNFYLIRITSACLVIFSHAFPLLALTYEPIESFFYIGLPTRFFVGLNNKKYFCLVPLACETINPSMSHRRAIRAGLALRWLYECGNEPQFTNQKVTTSARFCTSREV